MPTFRGNRGNLLQHWVLVELLDALHHKHASGLCFVDAYSMSPRPTRSPKVVTTLHGTDITVLGADPSYTAVTRLSVERSDAVTVPSRFLGDAARAVLDLPALRIEVIPNFVDCAHFAPPAARRPAGIGDLFQRFGGPVDETVAVAPTLVHVSNFRPVKRVQDVIAVYERVNAVLPCRLLLIGDGPDRAAVEDRVR